MFKICDEPSITGILSVLLLSRVSFWEIKHFSKSWFLNKMHISRKVGKYILRDLFIEISIASQTGVLSF